MTSNLQWPNRIEPRKTENENQEKKQSSLEFIKRKTIQLTLLWLILINRERNQRDKHPYLSSCKMKQTKTFGDNKSLGLLKLNSHRVEHELWRLLQFKVKSIAEGQKKYWEHIRTRSILTMSTHARAGLREWQCQSLHNSWAQNKHPKQHHHHHTTTTNNNNTNNNITRIYHDAINRWQKLLLNAMMKHKTESQTNPFFSPTDIDLTYPNS